MKYDYIKRIGDLIIASLAIVFLLPLFVVTAIIIRLESPGPALFRQKRYGKDKQPFTVYKFRSMNTQAPRNMPTNDFHDAHTYITWVGRIIRKLSIDELPQLINVLQGHMSLVGPRPVVLTETSLIDERDKHGANAVKPGITGWAQVNGRDELDDIAKAEMDGYYVDNFGFKMDAECVLKTIWVILSIAGHVEGHESVAKDNDQIAAGEQKMGKPKKHSAFSVVIAVYKNDCVEWFRQAVDSILDQTVASNDIVIVRDGTVSPELEQALVEYEKIHKEITVARLEQNVGAGLARNNGVERTKNNLVAIMDADDVSLPNRFELQLEKFASNPELALVGGQISEFEDDPSNITGYRKVPTEYEAIRKFARYRSPINNLTIMFKKDKFLAVGGYASMTRGEDYYMVANMLVKGFLVNNLDSVTVAYRVGYNNISRRKSIRQLRELTFARWNIKKLGMMSLLDFLALTGLQICILLLPSSALKRVYDRMLRSGN